MFLIADSGSTKTDWILCSPEKGIRHSFVTAGFNPIVQSTAFIHTELGKATDMLSHANQIERIYYFGAGCSSDERKDTLKGILQHYFPKADISVDHDMQASVIATCGLEAGFSCILGTGSNAVLFDGQQIIHPKGSLGVGYILGDEGSGAYIGKILLRDFLYKALPAEMQHYFEQELQLDKDVVLYNVYKQPNANTYLASFTRSLLPFRETAYVQQVLNKAFSDFYQYNICSFENYLSYPVNFIGSVATHFSDELILAAQPYSIQVGNIIQKPIERIVDFYIRLEQL